MKRSSLALATASACATMALCTSASVHKTKADSSLPGRPLAARPLNVAFVMYPNMELLDFSGPMDVFVKANTVAPGSYNIYTVGASTGSLSTEAGALSVRPRFALGRSPRPDILIVPGAPTETIRALGQDRAFVGLLRREAGRSRLVMSVCTGSFLLGQAGLLDGKKSTTHWFVLDDLQRQFPRTRAIAGQRFVVDGGLVTSAGVSSGLDGALYVVERTRGKSTADVVSRAIQYRRGTPTYPDAAPASRTKTRSTARSTARRDANALAPRREGERLAQSTDPCCGMEVKPGAITYRDHGRLYGFCSGHCREMFAAHPEQYVKPYIKPHVKSAPAP